jgi:hypothetical protein
MFDASRRERRKGKREWNGALNGRPCRAVKSAVSRRNCLIDCWLECGAEVGIVRSTGCVVVPIVNGSLKREVVNKYFPRCTANNASPINCMH